VSDTSVPASHAERKNATTSAETNAILHDRENLSKLGRIAAGPAGATFSVVIATPSAYD
jgi:hypothetical protein